MFFLSLLFLIASTQNCKISDEDKGDDSVCITPNGTNATWCCLYTSIKVGDADKVESWTCGPVPTKSDDDNNEVEGTETE